MALTLPVPLFFVCAQNAESAAAHHLSDDAKNMDKLLAQRVIFATKRDDCVKKIRELGALPKESFEKVSTDTARLLRCSRVIEFSRFSSLLFVCSTPL